MTDMRKQEILTSLQSIITAFTPTADEKVLSYFGLISRYNHTIPNPELIGGEWAKTNGINLPE